MSSKQREHPDPPPSATSGIPAEADRCLGERSAAFARATQRKGMPMTYGTGVLPPQAKKKRAG